MRFPRREFVKAGSAVLASGVFGTGTCASTPANAPRVVVVGGGYGGATAAKYIRKWSDASIGVTLVEREASFVSCPMSNLVLGGSRTIADITVPYDGLDKWGVRRMRDAAVDIDVASRKLKLASSETLDYDRMILSTRVDIPSR